MSDPQHKILVVDDQPANLLLILRTLESDYDVECVESGADCLASIDKQKPDLILLDVRMPNMDGYECCRRIREDLGLTQIPILFLSAHTELEDKLKGYEAGGDDYLTKPCDVREIIAKVELNLKAVDSKEEEIASIRSVANQAISNIGEMGVIIQFMEQSFECETEQALGELLINSLKNLDLNCTVQVRGIDEVFNLSASGQCSPIEVSLMEGAKDGPKTIERGKRFMINGDGLSLLVKNLPEDEMIRGRVKDSLGSIMNGASACVNNLQLAYRQEQATINKIRSALEKIEVTLKNLEASAEKKANDMSDILAKLTEEISTSFSSLALTEEQEQHFTKLLDDSSDSLFALSNDNAETEAQFSAIADMLFELISHKI